MTIKIGKGELPISFGFGAIMDYEQATGTPVLALFEQFQRGDVMFTEVVRLITCGLNNGARRAGSDKIYSEKDTADLLDESENPMQVVADCMNLLAGSFAQDTKKKTVTMAANRETRRKAS